jgi:hypothetical protein
MTPRERQLWFHQLRDDVVMLRRRHRLPVRSSWWENEFQVEVLAATAAWAHRYDTGAWDDPPDKLAPSFDLERVAQLLRDGQHPFDPEHDRRTFDAHVADQLG